MKNYNKITYNKKPITNYPIRLVRELSLRFWIWQHYYTKILDIGCGRGDYLRAFSHLNVYSQVEGYDSDPDVKDLSPTFSIKIGCSYPLPYATNTFDIVFCKSLIEHLYYPEELIKEIYRILRPGGKVIILTPDLETLKTGFWMDFTHRTPFIVDSLRAILEIHDFKIIACEKFIQLPFLWHKPQWLVKLITIIGALFYTKNTKNTFIRFSQEGMLLAVGAK